MQDRKIYRYFSEMSIERAGISVFCCALLIRLVFLVCLDSPFYFSKYPYFAVKLSQGESIGQRIVDLSPFYLYFLSAWHTWFGPSWTAVKWTQGLIGVANCWLIFQLGIRYFNMRVGLMAGLMAAAYGNLIVLESTLEPSVFVLLFNLLAVYFLSFIENSQARLSSLKKYIVISGFLTGLSVITKPSFLLFLPIGCLCCLLASRLPVRKRFLWAVFFVSAASTVILPVSIRNYVMLGDRVLVTADAGKVFFHGNGPGATALEWTFLDEGLVQERSAEPDYEHNLFRKTAERISGRPLLPSEASKFWFRRTLDHIFDNPYDHLWLVTQKFAFFFTDYELHYIGASYADYKSTRQWPFLRYGWIAGFGVVGLFLSAADWRKRLPIFGAFCVYLVTCLLFIVQSRYRTPATPYLCLFAAYAILLIVQRLNDGKTASAILFGLVACGLTVSSFTAFQQQINRIDQHQTAVNIYYYMKARPFFAKQNFEKAAEALNESIRLEPSFIPSRLLRGKIYAIRKKYEAAEIDFQRVIEMKPESSVGYKNLGMLYFMEDQAEEALKMLEIAHKLDRSDAMVLNALKRIKGESSQPVVWEIR